MKKQILFLCSDMGIGGFQKSLISLLQCFDYNKYDVDLLLFDPSGIFMDVIPDEVNVIAPMIEPDYFKSCKTAVKAMLNKGKIFYSVVRALSGVLWCFDKGYGAAFMIKAVPELKKHYDVAIDYNGQYILYYMIDKINADKKITYFHSDYKKWRFYERADRKYYKSVNAIVTVSDMCVQSMKEIFPEYADKVFCIENINSEKTVSIFEINSNTFTDNFDGIRIVSVGRVCRSKGFDLAIEALRRLIDNGYYVRWYEVGPIEDIVYCTELITKYSLQNEMVLLGATNNPYDYMRNSDIIVHPSRFEGKAVAVEEAKILHKPIVATNFSTVYNQIDNERTGLIVEMSAEGVYKGIKRLIDDVDLRNKIIEIQKKECTGNEDEVLKLYRLIEG